MFEIYKNKIEYINLDSLEGVLKLNELSYFSRFNSPDTIRLKDESVIFDSILISSELSHKNLDFYKHKRIIVSTQDKLGTDFPHFEIYINSSKGIEISYSFANVMGRKPSFFIARALNEIIEVLKNLFPGIDAELFKSKSRYTLGKDFWQQINSVEKKKFMKSQSIVKVYDQNLKEIKGLTNYGPFRVQTLGLYSYLCDIL
jgi:hypothetical protein